MVKKIFIDPGHGGSDSGAVGELRYEKNDNLALAMQIKYELQQQDGVEVKLSRECDTNPTINSRCATANDWDADYFISIHRDSATASVNGVSAWVYSKAPDKTYQKGKLICDAVAALGFKNRGTMKGAANYNDYGVNRASGMASCLIEFGFISNKADNKKFDEQFKIIAKETTKALCEIVGIEYK